MNFPSAVVQRFWAKVDIRQPDECWNWTAGLLATGYGQFGGGSGTSGKNWRAHRLAYAMTNGPIPAGQVVMHTCDNRRCVNPAHLELGTQKQNLVDMALRGRNARGVLTIDQVRECRRRAAAGEPLHTIAASYAAK